MLEKLFEAERRTAPEPGVDFLSRVLADADMVQQANLKRDAKEAAGSKRRRPAQPGFWVRFARRLDLFSARGLVGGGMAAAAVLGFGVGFSGGVNGSAWMSAVAPTLFDATADASMTLLPESDSFVISLDDPEGEAL